jgi:Domain of unknown function (DUF1707)
MAGELAIRRQRYGDVLASDAERERAIEELRAHYTAGRLTPAELEERVAQVCAARRRADIARAFESLPRRRRAGNLARMQRAAVRTHAAAYATVNSSLVGVWALTGEGRFWPAQLLLPWGVVLGWHLYAYRRWTRPRRPRPAR